MYQPILRFSLLVCVASVSYCATSHATDVEFIKKDGKVTVTLDGELFTEYVYEGHAKPILYPGGRTARDRDDAELSNEGGSRQ